MQQPRKPTIVLAIVGFSIAVIIFGYAELTDSSAPTPPPVNVPLWTAFMILCPPSLLSVPLIDVAPGSIDFVLLWLIIGLLNSALYAAIGAGIRKLFRKSG
jgi:hypothetical protein